MSIISLKQALNYGINELKKAKIDSARLDAEILLGFVLGFPREKLLANPQYSIFNIQYLNFKKLIAKRKKHYPITYLTNHKEFYGLNFYVNENVLVPRPETELLVEEVLKFFGGQGRCSDSHQKISSGSRFTRTDPKKILEIGTGSGCIALTLAKYLPHAKITATDISKKALAVARKNKKILNIKYSMFNINFKQSDLLSNIKSKPNIIVANLPYLTKSELKQKSIIREPALALYGGREGMEVYGKLFKQIKNKKWEDAILFLEIGEKQEKKFKKLTEKYFPRSTMETKKDLAGRDRAVIIQI